MESVVADALREIGYSCTSDKDRCRQTLTQLGGVREVTAPAVAQVIKTTFPILVIVVIEPPLCYYFLDL